VPLETLAPTRHALLNALKHAGEARADDLAAELGITVSAVRQHLSGLAADDLVDHREVRRGPGRPHHLYRLSDKGDGLFPRRYSTLAIDLLAELEEESPALLESMFERRRMRRVERAKLRMADRPLVEQVEELTAILDEDGYLAELVPLDDGRFRIVEHNCAILAVAARYGAACGTELDFLREVLPTAHVERVAHLLAGGHVCAYEITPATAPSTRRPKNPSPTS
jgi:DeoR family suf operon transcriptional repressor